MLTLQAPKDGVKPGKKRKAPVDSVQNKKKYEKEKRSRSFQDSWKKNYSWLIYDEGKDEMFCKVCRGNKHCDK